MFASTAIGVSHLVQSTRAGAAYSYAVLWAVLLACILKYPAFEYGSRYANATGESLIDGYKRFGNWALYVYLFITVSPMSIIIAAICFTTGGLLNNLLGLHLPVIYTSFAVIFGCVGILFIGTYRTLDGMIKIVCTVLFLSTLTAFVLTLSRGPNVPVIFYSDAVWTASGFAFLIALMGWMPAPLDLSALNSLWTLERFKQTNYRPSLNETLFDFNLSYFMTAALAVCFMTLGAFLMYGSGVAFSTQSGTQFTNEVIRLYTATLGDWSYLIIALSAFSVMFGTALVIFDGYARAMQRTWELLFGRKQVQGTSRNVYQIWLILGGTSGFLILTQFLQSFTTLIDLATVVSFVIAPIIAIANHRLVVSAHVPKYARPPAWLRGLSYAGIVFLIGFTSVFIWMRLTG